MHTVVYIDEWGNKQLLLPAPELVKQFVVRAPLNEHPEAPIFDPGVVLGWPEGDNNMRFRHFTPRPKDDKPTEEEVRSGRRPAEPKDREIQVINERGVPAQRYIVP